MHMRYGPAVNTSSAASASRHLVVGAFSPSVVLELARDTGALEREGLTVAERPVLSSPAQFQSLLDGTLDAALTSPDNVIAYRFSPANPLGQLLDARIVGAVDRGLGLGLYVGPGVEAQSLAGLRMGVDVPTSGFALALYALLEAQGVAREQVELRTLGSTPKRLTALLDAECDATMLNAGNELVAEQRGCRRIASVPDVVGPYLGTVVACVGDRNLDAARRLARALTAVAREVLAGRLDGEARAAARTRLGVDDDVADRYLHRLMDHRHGLVSDGQADGDALRTLVRLRQRYLPQPAPGGGDVLDAALDEAAGLVDRPGSP